MGGTDMSNAREVLAFLDRKHQVQDVSDNFDARFLPSSSEESETKEVVSAAEHPEPDDQVDMSLLPLIPYIEPSAPAFPDSPPSPSPISESDTVGTKANLSADFDVHTERVPYKGKGLVDKVYIPVLEEVCLDYPSLIECQKNRTPKYVGWAFIALGRVLQFLETTKVAEMNEGACECLELLWDEVQVFGFDLSWLAPKVEFALSMKGYMEKVRKVNELEEKKMSLELRIQELNMKLVKAEKELKTSKDDLAKDSEEFGEQIETERMLGYGCMESGSKCN